MFLTNEKRIEVKMAFEQMVGKLSDSRNKDYINNLIPADNGSLKEYHIELFFLVFNGQFLGSTY